MKFGHRQIITEEAERRFKAGKSGVWPLLLESVDGPNGSWATANAATRSRPSDRAPAGLAATRVDRAQ